MKAILGIKKGMTRVFDGEKSTPVTVVDVSGCKISKLGNGEIELGLGQKKKSTKSLLGQYKDLGFVPMYKKVFKAEVGEDMKVGNDIAPEIFTKGDIITLTGVSKGKGFAGVVKRWGFKGGPRTHGQSDRLRAPGSIGAGADPGRVWKGTRMGGRMGSDNITIKNKRIVDIKENYILVSGPVPGSNGDLVAIFSE
ncbi:50S ribosomal protein L3 [Candidatus Dojkabacteria bacterium HGW-Dojkabacteria-1]|uniref:50S ribosomal protein L3 n=1 Tax=Candidatus Dojkabacteria bacterium HGW-Dojkabacteria-1 TaxID=2013761 RepID=A0A2N2F2Y7_9BACT|nr:ribosomal protein L3 [uncultured bacterium]PKN02552.1 MAG: 50S ribosomal protein L3 [Candidatus Dojkabacteria bacterium HGW-Dojkabacteria-1]